MLTRNGTPARRLFVAESLHGVYAHGPVGWDITRDEGGEEQEGGDGEEGYGVVRRYADQEAGQELRYGERGDQAGDDAGANENGGMAQDQAEDAAGLGAQRHAHADFMSAAGGVVRDHAVHADYCQEQAQRAERAGESRAHLVKEEAVGAHE